jgi:WS/DGAT/MGAT family acyltransferase
VSNPDRLTGLDATFLHLERSGRAHMHVASILAFRGAPPSHAELIEHVVGRLHLVPRYRQRLADVPFGQGRPAWVDDPHFKPTYHVRHTALPPPGGAEELKRLAGRLFSQPLDRTKPLWEVWMVEGLAGDRFALIGKTHHALVDGVSGVDITTILFDATESPAPVAPAPEPWAPRPLPSSTELLAQALVERATVPGEMVRGARAALRAPRQVAAGARDRLVGVGAMAWAGLHPAPPSPLNVPIGPHRRYAWVDADLTRLKAVKDALGGKVNDVVLTAVALALGGYLRAQGHDTDGMVLKAMVPVSVRTEVEHGALGNRVAAMWAPLPVGERDARACFDQVRTAMAGLKESGQAVGAQTLTGLAGLAPTTILSQAARLQARQRFFNLVVTNIPGPQLPLYLLGRPLEALYPVVPLAERQALGIAVMSYCGRMGFGLLADYDAMPALDALADLLERALDDLSAVALGRAAPRRRRGRAGASRGARTPATSRRTVDDGAQAPAPAATTPGAGNGSGGAGRPGPDG